MADLTVTVAEVLAGADADFFQGIAGDTFTAGKMAYLDEITNTVRLCDANASLETAEILGVALHAASPGQPIRVQIGGTLTIGATSAPVVSTIYIASGAAGGIAPAADLASGWYTSVLGVCVSAGKIGIRRYNSHALKA